RAGQPGWLQALDPGAKIAMFLVIAIAASASTSLSVLIGLYLAILFVAWASRLPFEFFVKRVWLGIPLFAGIVVVPSLFMLPGPRLAELNLGPLQIGLSAPGAWG